MNLYSYVITHDSGFAPNPFGGFLTLATCKPKIRQHAQSGDWIVGTGSARTVGNHKLVYAARIADTIPIEAYGELPEYEIKRPSTRGERWRRHGDNIYFKQNDEWNHRRNMHHGPDSLERDVGGKNVLICNQFWYFGVDAIEIPPEFHCIIKQGPGHKKITEPDLIEAFVNWLTALPDGQCGSPEMEDAQPKSCATSRKPTATPRCDQ